jgi:hypothetical protein
LIDQRPERCDHVCRIELFEFEVSGLSAAIAHHEDRNLLGAEAALAGYAAPMSGWPGQVPLAFEGFEKEGFVRLDNPGLVFGTVPGRNVQEAMAPPKRRVLVDLATAGCLTQTDSFNQELCIARPLFALAQMRQCRPCQSIEGSVTVPTTVALEPVTLAPSPQPIVSGSAMRTSDRYRQRGLSAWH